MSPYNFDWVFLAIPVKNHNVRMGMLLTCPLAYLWKVSDSRAMNRLRQSIADILNHKASRRYAIPLSFASIFCKSINGEITPSGKVHLYLSFFYHFIVINIILMDVFHVATKNKKTKQLCYKKRQKNCIVWNMCFKRLVSKNPHEWGFLATRVHLSPDCRNWKCGTVLAELSNLVDNPRILAIIEPLCQGAMSCSPFAWRY